MGQRQTRDTLVVPAPAKVNLFLHVTGRREDRYHLLESLFALVDLADTVTLVRRDDGAIVRTHALAGVDEQADLAVRAALALRDATGTVLGASIAVDKRIPMGGGLGGGSSDAASVLLGLNRLWALGLTRAELAGIGVSLGADVPFFVHGENAIVRGIGEVVAPVSLPRQWLALALPAVPVPTASIFAAPQLTRSTPSAKINVFSVGYGRNDLEPVTQRPRARCRRPPPGSRGRVGRLGSRGGQCPDERLGKFGVRRVRERRRGPQRRARAAAGFAGPRGPHARTASARVVRAVTAGPPARDDDPPPAGAITGWGRFPLGSRQVG